MQSLSSLMSRLIKGIVIGATMLVPGVSGGTMAIILGIYDELIDAVSYFRENIKKNGILLLQYAFAGLAGILLLSKPMLAILNQWTNPVLFLFIGAILASIPPLYRKVRVAKIKPINIFFSIIGAFIALMTRFLPSGLLETSLHFDLFQTFLLFIAGFVIAIALVLPGISASYVLLMIGMYEPTLQALLTINIPYLLPLSLGALIGTFSTSKILSHQMRKHPQFTYMLIIGFMIGSLVQVFPGLPINQEIPACILTFLFGVAIITCLDRFQLRKSS